MENISRIDSVLPDLKNIYIHNMDLTFLTVGVTIVFFIVPNISVIYFNAASLNDVNICIPSFSFT